MKQHFDPGSPGYGNATAAAELAGYTASSRTSLASIAHKQMKRIAESGTMAALMDQAGISDPELVRRLKELMGATRIVHHEGKRVDEVPDNPARQRALEMAAKLRGHLDKGQDAGPGLNLNMAFVQALTVSPVTGDTI